ncbi:MAG: aminopeptidase P family protein [Clostridiales bacterium]|jgi:Xaa-Pro aminopeptidase|nr:aminopeptidase P family protein [Clostridiales bacterium]
MSDFDERITALRGYINKIGVDAVLISDKNNVFYISGFTGGDDAKLVVTGEHAIIITDSRYEEQVKLECHEFESYIYSRNLLAAINNVLTKRNVHKLAFENNSVSYNFYREIKGLTDIKLMEMGDYFIKKRAVKSITEIACIKKACKIASNAFCETVTYIRAGISEQDVACELEYRMKRMGAQDLSFETIVASGERGGMPHGKASEKLIESGDAITIDFGCIWGGYCSDMTRTIFVGPPPKDVLKIYDIVYEAQKAAIGGFFTGMSANNLDKIARDYIADFGYGANFGHSLGHGVGIEIHEEPVISPGSTSLLSEGMVFSVEPGIYLGGNCGVRIEDLVTPSIGKLNIMTNFDKKPVIVE